MRKLFILGGLFVVLTLSAQDIKLPAPVKTGGMPLMEALNKRQSTREFSPEDLSNQTISNLLWAAWGYNRENMRTAPSANNKQEMELFVALKSGAYRYDARNNILVQVTREDVRAKMGGQDFVATAPMNIVYVADKSKNGAAQTDCGFIAQNVYLFCASENLATVVRGYFDAKTVKEALKLSENFEPMLTQTVGKKK